MNIDTQKLENLLVEGKKDESREYIKSIIQAPLSKSERGDAIIQMTTAYMSIMNKINAEHKSLLEETLAELKEVNKLETSMNEDIDLKKVRAELA
jgi:hypothetical protein